KTATPDADARERFVEGWLTASLLFCVGPLTILGSLSDGLGRGIDQLLLKSVLDGFAALAFASSFGVGVLLSAVSVGVVQGLLTVAAVLLGSVLPDAHIAALTAAGGLMLVGIALRLLRIKQVAVGDLLPALVVAPLLTQLVAVLRSHPPGGPGHVRPARAPAAGPGGPARPGSRAAAPGGPSRCGRAPRRRRRRPACARSPVPR